MSKRGIRHCIICGKEYKYCPHCGADNKNETWRYLYDSESCMDIFTILSKYTNNHITKEEAKTQLKALKLSRDAKYTAEIQKQIDEIFKVEKAPKEEAQIVKED